MTQASNLDIIFISIALDRYRLPASQIISMEDDKLLELSVSLLAGGRSPLETDESAKPQGSVRLRVGRLHLLLLHKVVAEMQVRRRGTHSALVCVKDCNAPSSFFSLTLARTGLC